MSVSNSLEQLYEELKNTLYECNKAIIRKGVEPAKTFNDIPSLINKMELKSADIGIRMTDVYVSQMYTYVQDRINEIVNIKKCRPRQNIISQKYTSLSYEYGFEN